MYIKLPFTFMGLTHIITPVHFKVSQGSIQGTILSMVLTEKAHDLIQPGRLFRGTPNPTITLDQPLPF